MDLSNNIILNLKIIIPAVLILKTFGDGGQHPIGVTDRPSNERDLKSRRSIKFLCNVPKISKYLFSHRHRLKQWPLIL